MPSPLSASDVELRPASRSHDEPLGDFAALGEIDERKGKLIENIYFSRRLIWAYQATLIAIVVLFALSYWLPSTSRRWRWRWQNFRQHHESGSLTNDKASCPWKAGQYGTTVNSASSSRIGSTLFSGTHGASDEVDEQRPLVSSLKTKHGLRARRNFASAFRSFGMYQPPNIPLANKVLPSNFMSLLILLLLGLNVFFLVYKSKLTLEFAFGVGDRAALLFIANLPWLYLLSARNQPLKHLVGASYEHLNILHRRLGELLCFFALIHASATLATWYYFLRPEGIGFTAFFFHGIVLLGLGAFACYELLFITSLASLRQWWYEAFLASHVLLQAGALLFLFFHHFITKPYTAAALAIFLIDRLIYRCGLKSCSVRADLRVLEDGDTLLVSASWPVQSDIRKSWLSFIGLGLRHGWKPSEHVFLTVPALGRTHVIQAHPFTIASAAPEVEQRHAWFNIIVRVRDGFTKDLLHYSRSHSTATIRLDGPYGSLHALDMLRNSATALLVAGGSGIAVAYPMIWSLLHGENEDTELVQTQRRVCLIWVVHDASHLSWIGHERLDELREKGLSVIVPPPTSKTGRPDMRALVRDVVGEINGTVGVVVSGPDGMNREVRNTCAQLSWQGYDIHVAVEKFGW